MLDIKSNRGKIFNRSKIISFLKGIETTPDVEEEPRFTTNNNTSPFLVTEIQYYLLSNIFKVNTLTTSLRKLLGVTALYLLRTQVINIGREQIILIQNTKVTLTLERADL